MEALRGFADQRRPARMTHDMAVASGERMERGGLSAADAQMETHHGVCVFVKMLPYFDMGLHVIHDDMHNICNTVNDTHDLSKRKGTQRFTTKRRNIEHKHDRFTEVNSNTMPFFGLNEQEQGRLDELLRSLRLPSAWPYMKHMFAKKHRSTLPFYVCLLASPVIPLSDSFSPLSERVCLSACAKGPSRLRKCCSLAPWVCTCCSSANLKVHVV